MIAPMPSICTAMPRSGAASPSVAAKRALGDVTGTHVNVARVPPADPPTGASETCYWAIPDPVADCCCTTLPLPTVTAGGPWLLMTIGPWPLIPRLMVGRCHSAL
jgi:hypothetical protein